MCKNRIPIRSFILLITGLLLVCFQLSGQETSDPHALARKLLAEREEVCIEFVLPKNVSFSRLEKIMSIDLVDGEKVRAYANVSEFDAFLQLGLSYTTLLPRKQEPVKRKSLQDWDSYPSYQEYLDVMQAFADNHPSISRLVNAGKSVGNRDILFIKISDNPGIREAEPVVLYTSTMHGDETVGYVMMLRLIDTLLNSYGQDPEITNLVDGLEIWINPLANPDGAYFNSPGGELTDPRRYNDNGYDLNRNFPDPRVGENPNGPYQPETLVMMEFMDTLGVSLSANFHGGAEVMNYPWDTWYTSEKVHSDQDWFIYISREYADTAQYYSPEGYMEPSWSDNGITNGAAWYRISGGRQDYMTYFLRGREVTMEISNSRFPPPSSLGLYWEYNRRSLLSYLEQAMFGIQGIVSDAVTGEPLVAKIEIPGHDSLRSEIWSKGSDGYYTRLIGEGSYDLMFTATGYDTLYIEGVSVNKRELTRLDAALSPSVEFPTPDSSWIMKIAENPPIDRIWIEYQFPTDAEFGFTLYDFKGSPLWMWDPRLLTAPSGEVFLPLPSVAQGMYVIVAKGPLGYYAFKIFIR